MYSSRPPHKFIFPLVATLIHLLLCVPMARAEYPAGDGHFALWVVNHDVDLTYPNSTRRTRMTNVTASWQQSFSARLRGGIQLSYLDLSQASNPLVSGTSSTGYGVGIDLRGLVIDRNQLQTELRVGYSYQATEGSSANQNTEYRWHRLVGGVDFTLFPRSTVALLTGASLASLDGEQRDTGIINRITDFSEDDPLGYYAGLSIRTDPGGRIGIKWYGGRSQGFYLLFSRKY